MTTHHHPKFGTITLDNEQWNLVCVDLRFEDRDVKCALTQIPTDTSTDIVRARLDILSTVIENLDTLVTKARLALVEEFKTSDSFTPWVKAWEQTFRDVLGLKPSEEISPEIVAQHFKVTDINVTPEIALPEFYRPYLTDDFSIDMELILSNEQTQYHVHFQKTGDIIIIHGPSTGAYYPEEDTEDDTAPHFIHDILGECDGENLTPVKLGGEEIALSLYMSAEQYQHLTAADLDHFVPLIDCLTDFDVLARTALPTQTSYYFHDLWNDDNYRRRLLAVFPNIKQPSDISADQIMAAARLNLLTLSLDLSGSNGAALSMDYNILPDDDDFPEDTVFCAKFSLSGKFLGISVES